MDGGRSQGARTEGAESRWRSTIPGVSQRDGAPATLGLAAWGLGHGGAQAAAQGEAGSGRAQESPGAGGVRDGRPPVVRAGGPARARHRLPWRAMVLGGLALLAILGVARVAGADAGLEAPGVAAAEAIGWEAAGGGGSDGPEPAPPQTPTAASDRTAAPDAPGAPSAGPPDWWEVLAELDRRRGRALTALDPDLVSDYARPESPAWSADTGVVADLRARGLRPQGLGSRVLAVERADLRGGRARVQVVDQRSAYSLVDARGEVVERVPAAGLMRWSVTVAEEPSDPLGWRVVEVTAVRAPDVEGDPSGEAVP